MQALVRKISRKKTNKFKSFRISIFVVSITSGCFITNFRLLYHQLPIVVSPTSGCRNPKFRLLYHQIPVAISPNSGCYITNFRLLYHHVPLAVSPTSVPRHNLTLASRQWLANVSLDWSTQTQRRKFTIVPSGHSGHPNPHTDTFISSWLSIA